MMQNSREILVRRRSFLLGSASLSAGFMLAGCDVLGIGARDPVPAGKLGAYIEIFDNGAVAITTPGAEMGQGVSSTLPKIIAEELGADWEKVEIRLSGFNPVFAKPNGRQISANSDAVMSYFEPLRNVGAAARQMLTTAAAAQWNVPVDEVDVAKGVLTHRGTGKTLGFGDVAEDAAKLPIPENPQLKDPENFELIGKVTARKDIPPKVMGTAEFGIDVELPDMLHAAVRHVPVTGAKLGNFDASKARSMPGVVEIVPLDKAVAVIAESYWQAQQAVNTITFETPQEGRVDTDQLMKSFRKELDNDRNKLPFPVGGWPPNLIQSAELAEVNAAINNSARQLQFEYSVPYLAHATLEPMCATALVEPGRCEFWAPTQSGESIPRDVSAATGIPAKEIIVNRTYLGGGFGRKNDRDFLIQAAQIAQAKPGRPVKMIWSREQDMKHSHYRAGIAVRSKVGLAPDGAMAAVHSRAASQAMTTGFLRFEGLADPSIIAGLISPDYNVGTKRIDAAELEAPIPTSYWRSVTASSNGFFTEALINDIAGELGRDPYQYRLEQMIENPRGAAVLKLAAEKAGWTAPKPNGTGRGIAYASGWNSHIAQVIEVSVKDKQVEIEKITCAFDCGLAVDPDNVIAQIEGGIIFGLSAALFGKITWKEGQVEQNHYADYPVVTLANSPRIDVHLIATPEELGGVGEAGVPPVAAALTGAIRDATGEAIRDLPIVDAGYWVQR
ncbi:molybdopterin cofactor-binding domain-containing protein [Altererythrobacter sp. GH1-8]|uniref:xanthine dehydrogenase family protein molybdopterin-binding subunit n=1 Tax=Altererythrobacter sp. GH1-8 TaxID=3349333 RepID=UPI00374D21FF